MADDKEILVRIKGLDELTPIMAKALASMEASSNKLAQSLDRIAPAADNAKKGAEELNTGAINLAAGLSVVNAAIELGSRVWGAISETIHKAVDEALEAEKAINQLNGAMVSQGIYTEENVKRFRDYIDTTEEMTGVSGEATASMLAMGLQMGLNASQAEKMEEAARKLAAVTGTDVLTAFNQLQGSLNGQTRALAKILPDVKDLTATQLKQGAAIALVNDQLAAQYNIYEKSFSVALGKAKNNLSNVYEEIGKIIIQNPLVIKAVNAFAEGMTSLAKGVAAADQWVRDNQDTIVRWGKAILTAAGAITGIVVAIKSIAFGAAVFDALSISMKLYGVAGTLAANGINIATVATTGLKAAITFLTGPIGLTILAVGALTAAFYKWPGLFDQIVGGFKILVGMMTEGLGFLTSKAAALVSIFDKDLAKSLQGVSDGITNQGQKWQLAGVKQTEYGDLTNANADKNVSAVKKETAAIDDLVKASERRNAAARNKKDDMYGGVDIGSTKSRKSDELSVGERNDQLKDFQQYLDQKKRLAVTSEQEQAMEVAKVRADALKEGSSSSAKSAGDSYELMAEQKKQSDLKVLRDRGILNEKSYQDAMFESRQRSGQIELKQAQEQQLAMAEALGNTEEAYQIKKDLEQQRFDQDLQTKMERAQLEGATQQQLDAMTEQAKTEHLAAMRTQDEKYYEDQATMNEQAGNNYQAYLNRVKAAQVQHGTVLGAMVATTQSNQYKMVQQSLGNLSTLMDSHSKKAFAIGKAAAMANAIIGTAQAVVSALATPPFPLGLVLAATAAAAGFVQIQKISSTQFQGGQADEGMDSIPQALAGKSFVLSQGERVVQPQANKDLTAFLNGEKGSNGGGRGGGTNYNITLEYRGMGGTEDARKVTEMIVAEIRKLSERGAPIMSDKGIVKS